MVSRWALALAITVGAGAGAASASGGIHRFFRAPGSNAPRCELAAGVPGLGTFAYCVVGPKHALSVKMTASGHLNICRGLSCMSDAPEKEPTLRYGASISAGPFRCTSQTNGVRCVVSRTRHGFRIGPTGLTRV